MIIFQFRFKLVKEKLNLEKSNEEVTGVNYRGI